MDWLSVAIVVAVWDTVRTVVVVLVTVYITRRSQGKRERDGQDG